MMKSFFKKLAFVMALAMVVSLAAPAAKTAVAAEEKKPLGITYQADKTYTISEVNLAKVGATEDLRFLYAPDNWKELGVNWSSSNENVVTVDDGGVVTGIAAGKADVTVAIGTESATVTVYVEDTQTYTAKMGTDAENLITEWTLEEAGDTIDLAFFGIKDYARDDYSGNGTPRYFCEWDTTDPEVATVDNKGLVTAVAPGKAKITLIVWNLKLGTKHNVDACWITVPEAEPEATPAPAMEVINESTGTKVNTTQNKVVIKFSEATDVSDLVMFRVFTADDDEAGVGEITEEQIDKGYEDFYVNSFKPNTDKTVWTIETYEDFTDGVTYEIVVNNKKFVDRFVASVGAVAKVVVSGDGKAALATEDLSLVPETLSVKLYDAKGVDVTTRKVNGLANNDDANINYELVEYSDNFSLFYNQIEFYADETAKVYAIYDNYDVETPVESAPIPVRPGTIGTYGVKKIIDWTIVQMKADGTYPAPDWSAPIHEVPAGETDYVIATLLQDTRNDYYCTLKSGCGSKKYNDKTVYWTESTEDAFWLNGFYVEYKAMHPDTMLVETDGEIASYETGKARFALYLYNQNFYGADEFVKELYSQYVTVCHPKQLANFKVSSNTIDLMKNTEWEYCDVNNDNNCYAGRVYDAYYTEFSEEDFTVTLLDIHGGDAKKEDADTADFSIKLTSETNNAALAQLVEEDFAAELNKGGVKRTFTIGANDFLGVTTKNQVKFRITDNTTKKSQNITINLIDMVKTQIRYENEDALANDGFNVDRYEVIYATNSDVVTVVSDVALIREFVETVRSYRYFEKFVIKDKKFTVDNRINDIDDKDKPSLNGWEILLLQQDRNGHAIGYDNNLWVADAAIKNNQISGNNVWAFDETNHDEALAIVAGDRVLVVTDNSGKVYPVIGSEYANPAYKNLPTAYDYLEAPATTTALGIYVKEAGTATSATGDALTTFTQYCIDFRTHSDGRGSELIYAKDGTYTATIRTVEDVKDGIVYFAKETGLTDKVTFTVKNTNAQVTYASRDLVKKDASITNYIYDATKTITKEIGDDDAVKALILEAFNFNLGGAAWGETGDNALSRLDASDILYYEYTVTPSNNQLVINTVTFKVPAERAGDNTDLGNGYGWYRSTATVNKSITFED